MEDNFNIILILIVIWWCSMFLNRIDTYKSKNFYNEVTNSTLTYTEYKKAKNHLIISNEDLQKFKINKN